MRILILDTYYPAFLRSLYDSNPGLAHYPYAKQMGCLMDQCFGTANFYSSNLNQLGHEAKEVVTNCEQLQRQWAKEHGVKLREFGSWRIISRRGLIPWPRRSQSTDWGYRVLMAQVKQYSPDVLYVQDMNSLDHGFLREMRQYVRLIVGQIACPIAPGADFREYDLVLSSLPLMVEQLSREGLTTEYFRLGFEPRVLRRLSKGTRSGVAFVGSISTSHAERIEFLEKIAAVLPIDVWGHGIDGLNHDSPLRKTYRGEAWALDMYQALRNAQIALNHHIDMARPYANNMRLFEATGVGTLLVTDWKVNLHDLFEPGKEVVSYRTPEECAELIRHYLGHPNEGQVIAEAGQRRTLSDHTYYHRMQELVQLIKPQLSSSRRVRAL